MSFADQSTAAKMRDLISDIATSVVNNLRPEIRLARVFDYDATTGLAQVLLTGEVYPDTISARFGPDLVPSQAMIETYDTLGEDSPCNIVQISGRAGRFYISGYFSGAPQHLRYEGSVVPIGGYVQVEASSSPMSDIYGDAQPRLLPCDGTVYQIADFPALFAVIGNKFGGDGVTTFAVPVRAPEWPDYSSTDIAGFQAASGWTIDSGSITLSSGNLCQIRVTVVRSGADLVPSGAGYFSGNAMLTLADPKFYPVRGTGMVFMGGHVQTAALQTYGTVTLAYGAPGQTFANGNNSNMGATYLIAPPTNAVKLIRAF